MYISNEVTMDWLNIKEVLPPETIREILNKRNIGMIKYYPKPRDETSCTTILIEVFKRKEIVPTALEVYESLPPFQSKVNRISVYEKTIRYRDRSIFTIQEISNIATVFRLLGLKVYP